MTSTARVDEIDMRDLLPYVYVNFQHSSKDLRGICCDLPRYAHHDVHERILRRAPVDVEGVQLIVVQVRVVRLTHHLVQFLSYSRDLSARIDLSWDSVSELRAIRCETRLKFAHALARMRGCSNNGRSIPRVGNKMFPSPDRSRSLADAGPTQGSRFA